MHFRTPTAAKAPLSLLPWQASFSASANPIDALRRPRHRRHLSESVAANIAEEDSNGSFDDGGGPGTPGSYNEDTGSRHGGGLNRLINGPKALVKRLLPSQRSTGPSLPTRDFMGSAAPTCAAVTSHPPVIPWDDTPDSSMKYETPYYNTLPNALWLPRDPFVSVMDLDDTVELHRVLTSTVHEEEQNETVASPDSNFEMSFNIPQSHSPPPISIDFSAATGGSEEGGESAPLSQSPAPLSGIPSQDRLSVAPSVSSHTIRQPLSRRRASVTEVGERNRLPLRRPSIAEALHVSPSPGRRITSATMLAAPSTDAQPMGHATLLAGIRGSRRGDTISVAGISAFSQRSTGRPRMTSIQTRTAIEARVREESQREDESRRLLERTEALEDQEAERGATTVRWNTLKRLISVRAPARD